MKRVFKLFFATVCLGGFFATSAQALNTAIDFGPARMYQAPNHHES